MKLGGWVLASLLLLFQTEPPPPAGYFCPMHPDVISSAPGTCRECKMDLIAGNPLATAPDYLLDFRTVPRGVKPGKKVELRFRVFDPRSQAQVRDFEIVHEQPYHLFVVSQDTNHFFHLHPEKTRDGTFSIELTLPEAGYYKVFSDFLPRGGTPQVIARPLITAGFSGDLFSSLARLEPDPLLKKTTDGMIIELGLEPRELIAGREGTLKYHLTDSQTGQPIVDLQPYLGAWGHTLILSEDLVDYLHSHPAELIPQDGTPGKLRGGPEVTFQAFFPRPRKYRVWSQFLRNDRLTTVSFTVEVYRLGASPSRNQ